MAEYTTLCELKPFLGIKQTDKSADTLLSQLIPMVSEFVDSCCNRTFALASYTEFYSGKGYPLLPLRQRPVLSVESVYLDDTGYWGDGPDAFDSAKLLVEGTDFALQRDQPDGSSLCGLLYRIGGVWRRPIGRLVPPGVTIIATVPVQPNGNLKVSYTAGYETVPGPVKLAVQIAIARLFRTGKFGAALTDFAFEDYSYKLAIGDPDDILGPAKRMLAKFIDPVV